MKKTHSEMAPRFMAAGSWPRNACNHALQALMQTTRVKTVLKRAAILAGALPLLAAPAWRAPAQIPLGELVVIELWENDPTLPALPRPGEDKLGQLAIRSISPTENNRGWRLTLQALAPGLALIPPIDLGGGRISPELKIQVVRTVPYGAPWMGFGGGGVDAPPLFRFPWEWALLCAMPLAVLVYLIIWLWSKGSPKRRLKRAKRAFAVLWPPGSPERGMIDQIHKAGMELIAIAWGNDAKSWGEDEFTKRNIKPWAAWRNFIDNARFGDASKKPETAIPTLLELIKSLDNDLL
ncbi:MAG: hypothetical protein LBQ86_06120 [Holophagales bacterium]|jgi:hypothetical protein|nr:hypothetical protein [Holophagales bacterium]